MCFKYEQSLGSYVQTVDMYNSNSIFETTVDISKSSEHTISQFTVHRNSYKSRAGKEKYKFSVSLIYDEAFSKKELEDTPAVDAIVYQVEIIGELSTYKMQETILYDPKTTDNKLKLKIDLTKTWLMKIDIND